MVSHLEISEEVSRLSSGYADMVMNQAFTQLRGNLMLSDWCDDVTERVITLSMGYCKLTEDIFNSAQCDALEEYEKYYTIVYHLSPFANRIAERILNDAINIQSYCHVMCGDIMGMVKQDICAASHKKSIEAWAERKAYKILRSGLAKFFRTKCKKRSKVSDCSSTGSSESCSHHDAFADILISRIFFDCKIHNPSSHSSSLSDKSRSSQSGSCESISSGLLSPQSTADSSGLHRFADKLLYSLSALEKGSNDSISSTDTYDAKFSIVDCYRRSSAPELRVSSRKSSLKTVFEELPVEFPVTSSKNQRKLKIYPSTSLGRRLRSSDERRSTSMDNITKASARSTYSAALAKDIMSSAFQDVM